MTIIRARGPSSSPIRLGFRLRVAQTNEQRRDPLEILEDRHGRKSTIITSQLPIDLWHEWLGEATLADAIIDRLVYNAHIVTLEGDSMRKRMAKTLDLH
jgi:DNA replication protein DnaC